jgi:putative peptide zinc metalloprotease protein
MNLGQVLHEALPEAPPPSVEDVYPRVHPNLIAKEHTDREGTMVRVIPPGGELLFRLTKQQYELVKLFDGQRSYAQVAVLFFKKTGVRASEQQVRAFADSLDKGNFWYRTPQEQSILMCHKLLHDRHTHANGAMSGDLARIDLLFFDPDRYLTWLYKYLWFMYTPWFFALTAVLLITAIGLLSARWDEVFADSVAYYNLTAKGPLELGLFFLDFVLLGAIHETAHGLTVKHFGAGVHKMGFYLVYGVPAMFCDVTEVYVHGGRWARIMTTFAGVWSEMMLVSVVTFVWWFTPRGSFIHDVCYTIILAGGILVVLINWNPFSKLDGYFLFNEIFHFFDIKSQSTTFLVQWIRKNIFHLSAKVPVLPVRRQFGFAAYALLSGFYCYGMLLFFVRIAYKIADKYSPTWAFLPAFLLFLFIFKSRIKKLIAFCKEVYVDKKPLLRAHARAIAVGATAVLLLLLLPLFHEGTEQPFVLRPVSRALLHAESAGEISGVNVREGQHVQAGMAVATLTNMGLESRRAYADTQLRLADYKLMQSQMRSQVSMPAMQAANRFREERNAADQQLKRLTVLTPIAGTVISAHPEQLQGRFVEEGTELLEVADESVMEARVFIPESELKQVQDLRAASLRPEGRWGSIAATIVALSPDAYEVDPGLMAASKYKGVKPPKFYLLTVQVANDGTLRSGMTGRVKLFGRRRSALALTLEPVLSAVARRIW